MIDEQPNSLDLIFRSARDARPRSPSPAIAFESAQSVYNKFFRLHRSRGRADLTALYPIGSLKTSSLGELASRANESARCVKVLVQPVSEKTIVPRSSTTSSNSFQLSSPARCLYEAAFSFRLFFSPCPLRQSVLPFEFPHPSVRCEQPREDFPQRHPHAPLQFLRAQRLPTQLRDHPANRADYSGARVRQRTVKVEYDYRVFPPYLLTI